MKPPLPEIGLFIPPKILIFNANSTPHYRSWIPNYKEMALVLTIVFFTFFFIALARGEFSYKDDTYKFKEHPVQFTVILLFILGFALFCLNRFLEEMGIKLIS